MKRDRRDCLAGLGTTRALLAAAPWLPATFEIYPGTHTGDIAVRSQEHVAASRRSRTSTRHALPYVMALHQAPVKGHASGFHFSSVGVLVGAAVMWTTGLY